MDLEKTEAEATRDGVNRGDLQAEGTLGQQRVRDAAGRTADVAAQLQKLGASTAGATPPGPVKDIPGVINGVGKTVVRQSEAICSAVSTTAHTAGDKISSWLNPPPPPKAPFLYIGPNVPNPPNQYHP